MTNFLARSERLNRLPIALLSSCLWLLTHNTLVEVPLDGDQHVTQRCAKERCGVHVLGCPHVMAHLHEHVERVKAVDFISQRDQTVKFCLNAVEDLIHHLPHHVLTERRKERKSEINNLTWRWKEPKSQEDIKDMNVVKNGTRTKAKQKQEWENKFLA